MTFRRNEAGITGVLNSSGVLALLTGEAAAVARGAPRFLNRRTGHAARSYKSTLARPGFSGGEAVAYTDDVAGHIFEWGSVKATPKAPLRRAAEAQGLRVRTEPKP